MKITLNVPAGSSNEDIEINLINGASSNGTEAEAATNITSLSALSLSESTASSASAPKNKKSRTPWKPDEVYEPLPPPKGDIYAAPWTPEREPPILFINASVVDVASASVLPSHSVLIKEGLVISVKPTAEADMSINQSAEGLAFGSGKVRIVDLEGLYLCPGLIDCHVHVNSGDGHFGNGYVDTHLKAAYSLKMFLTRGFTTVRDVGGATLYQAQASEQWLTPGPRIIQGGAPISQTAGHGDGRLPYDDTPAPQLVDGVPAALKAARDRMRKGASHVKVMTSGGVGSPTDKLESLQFTPEELSAITGVVKAMGGRMVTSHCYTAEGIHLAVMNGVGCIEHGNLMDEPSAELMAKHGVFFTPTLMISQSKGRLPWSSQIPEYMKPKNAMVRDKGLDAIRIADKAGVVICFGTDLTMGMGYLQSEEFTVRRKILPDAKVLAHATINAAQMLGFEGKMGCICAGSFADLLVLSANPLEDVRVLDAAASKKNGLPGLLGVVKDGKIVVARGEFKELSGGVDIELGVE